MTLAVASDAGAQRFSAITPAPFPWDEAIGFGLGVLRLSPDAFWRMTPRELAHAALAGKGERTPPVARATLIDLMKRFPDG